MKALNIIAVLTAFAAVPVHANERGGRRPVPPVIEALDSDSNGTISSGEITNASSSLLTLDTNGDGVVSGDEMRPQRGGGSQGRPSGGREGREGRGGQSERPPFPVMEALDSDADGTLSVGEISSAASALAGIDSNGDGSLSRDEMHPSRTSGEGERGGRPSREGGQRR